MDVRSDGVGAHVGGDVDRVWESEWWMCESMDVKNSGGSGSGRRHLDDSPDAINTPNDSN